MMSMRCLGWGDLAPDLAPGLDSLAGSNTRLTGSSAFFVYGEGKSAAVELRVKSRGSVGVV